MNFDLNNVRLQPFTEADLRKSTHWLNDPEIKHLSHTPDFTEAQQLAWFHSLPDRKDYLVKAIYHGDEMIGSWGLKNINEAEGHAEPFYYIGDKSLWGYGIGGWLMDRVFEFCREKGLKKVVAKTLAENYRGVNLWFKKGFKIVDYNDGIYSIERIL